MFSRFSAVTLMLSLTFSFLISTSHAAKIYHWIDEKGQPHYSENPPREVKSEALNVRATGTGSAGSAIGSRSTKATTTKPKTTDENNEESLKSEHSPEDKAKFCQQSRNLLQQMNGNTQRRFEQEDGSYRKLEQAEIADYKAQAQSGIERFCQ